MSLLSEKIKEYEKDSQPEKENQCIIKRSALMVLNGQFKYIWFGFWINASMVILI